MFDSAADRDMATLATTDLDIEALYPTDPDAHPLDRGYTELDLLAACEQQVGFLHAMQFRALARMRLSLALTLTDRLPATLTALERGEVDLRRVQKLAELTDPLPVAVARAVEAAVLPDAKGQNTSELARAARKAIARLDPDGAQTRHQNRRADRRVVLYPMDDAMAELRAYLPAADATRVYRKVNQAAHAAAGTGGGSTGGGSTGCGSTGSGGTGGSTSSTAGGGGTSSSTSSSTGGGGNGVLVQ